MTLFTKNMSCSISLVITDFLSFVLSLYFSVFILSLILNNFDARVPNHQL